MSQSIESSFQAKNRVENLTEFGPNKCRGFVKRAEPPPGFLEVQPGQ